MSSLAVQHHAGLCRVLAERLLVREGDEEHAEQEDAAVRVMIYEIEKSVLVLRKE